MSHTDTTLQVIYTSIIVDHKEDSIRNSASKTRALADLLNNKLGEIEINFGWVPGPQNPADLASKSMDKPVAACNGPLWREGPTLFTNIHGLRKNTYGRVTKDSKEYQIIKESGGNHKTDPMEMYNVRR